MENYSPHVRPVKDFSDTLLVKMKVILQQIVGLVRWPFDMRPHFAPTNSETEHDYD
jgi:hypothetical protein